MYLSEWIAFAKQGREVDFFYKHDKYSISANYNKWFLTKYGEYENAQEFDSFLDLIYNARIDSIPFRDICSGFDIDAIY